MSVWARVQNWCSRWRRAGSSEATPRDAALLPRAFLSVLEDVLSWDCPQLSLSFVAFINVLFLVCMQLSISFLELIFMVGMFVTLLDALEAWLRHKRRTALLRRLAECDNRRLQHGLARARRWLAHRKEDFMAMRETNPTKAFLLVNIILGGVLVVGRAISGALLLYLVTMSVVLLPVASPYLVRFVKKIHQSAESDGEIDSLIPELSEQNLKELNFEGEGPVNTRQSVEPWLPEGAPPTDTSDSSDDDSGAPGSLPLAAAHPALDARDTSDSSDDEYLPKPVEEKRLRSTVEVVPEAPASWSSSLWSLRATLSGLVWAGAGGRPYATLATSSADSSDGFEFIEQSDL